MLGSGNSVLVLMHITYLAHLLTVCSLAGQTLSASGGSALRDYYAVHSHMCPQIICSGLGSAPTATAHAQNVLHESTLPASGMTYMSEAAQCFFHCLPSDFTFLALPCFNLHIHVQDVSCNGGKWSRVHAVLQTPPSNKRQPRLAPGLD